MATNLVIVLLKIFYGGFYHLFYLILSFFITTFFFRMIALSESLGSGSDKLVEIFNSYTKTSLMDATSRFPVIQTSYFL